MQELACRHQTKLGSLLLNRQASVVTQCGTLVNVGEQQVEVMKVEARATASRFTSTDRDKLTSSSSQVSWVIVMCVNRVQNRAWSNELREVLDPPINNRA